MTKAIKMMTYNQSLPIITDLKNSLGQDKLILKLEDGNSKDLAILGSINNSVNIFNDLDIEHSQDITFEEMILKKEDALSRIKRIFIRGKAKPTKDLNKVVIKEPFESLKLASKLLIGAYPSIVANINNNKIPYNDFIGNYQAYADKLEAFYKEYVSNDIFLPANIVGKGKLKRHGVKMDDKLDLLGGQKLDKLYKINFNKAKAADKSKGLNVVEYRYIPIQVFDIVSYYLLRYCKIGDIEFLYYTMESATLNKPIPTEPILVDQKLVDAISEINVGEKINLPMPDSDLVYEGTTKGNVETFISTIDTLVGEAKYDVKIFNTLNDIASYNYFRDWVSELDINVGSNPELVEYLFNIVFDNYHDNVEQGHYNNYYIDIYDEWAKDELVSVLKSKNYMS